jgi:hypothetical protein
MHLTGALRRAASSTVLARGHRVRPDSVPAWLLLMSTYAGVLTAVLAPLRCLLRARRRGRPGSGALVERIALRGETFGGIVACGHGSTSRIADTPIPRAAPYRPRYRHPSRGYPWCTAGSGPSGAVLPPAAGSGLTASMAVARVASRAVTSVSNRHSGESVSLRYDCSNRKNLSQTIQIAPKGSTVLRGRPLLGRSSHPFHRRRRRNSALEDACVWQLHLALPNFRLSERCLLCMQAGTAERPWPEGPKGCDHWHYLTKFASQGERSLDFVASVPSVE